MSSTSAATSSFIHVEEWEALDPEEPVLHHLPFKIAHTGLAHVSKYLVVKPTGVKGHIAPINGAKPPITIGEEVKMASFRGRYLKGAEVTLSDSYSGIVFREEVGEMVSGVADLFEPKQNGEVDDEMEDLKGASNVRAWSVQNKFKKYMYWTRHSKPGPTDRHAKWVEWTTTIAPSLHATLRPEDLTKPLKYVLNSSNASTTTHSDTPVPNINAPLPEKKGLKRDAPDSGHDQPDDEHIKKILPLDAK